MAKCFNCGKSFDYEKYYGICPKCSAYNKEMLSEEEHQELHEKYDGMNPHSESSHEQMHKVYDEVDPHAEEYRRDTYGNTSSASIIGFVCILLGIVAAIIVPITYVVVNLTDIMSMTETEYTYGGESWSSDREDDYSIQKKEILQNPELITLNPGEKLVLGEETQCEITVEEAYIVAFADTVEGFPKGENLVAFKINYQNNNTDLRTSYDFMDIPYVGYQKVFKECLDEYDLVSYEEVIENENALDVWELKRDINGNGVFFAFVPADVINVDFYLESRVESTNDISVIYKIPLEVKYPDASNVAFDSCGSRQRWQAQPLGSLLAEIKAGEEL